MAGDWKTIEQREQSQARARRTRRRGRAAVGAGVGLIATAEALRPGLTRSHLRAVRSLYSREARAKVHPMIRHDMHRSMYRDHPYGQMQLGGVGLAAVGGVGMAQGRAREAYQQSRINSRRRGNAARAKPVTKSMFPLRRAAKVAGPVIRDGVTRAGRVGVSYEHKGTTGWGLNASAARANWEASRVSSTGAVRTPRLQPRYGNGGSGGRRIIEKAASSGRKPAPARTAKSVPAAGAQKEQRPSVVDGPVIARGKVTGIVPMTAGAQEQAGAGFGKADRYFDPEDRRQRRIGATSAAAALGGGALGYSGGKELATTGSLSRLKDPNLRLSRLTPVEGPLLRGRKRRHQLAGMHPNQVQPEELAALRGLHVTPRAAGKVGGGIALLGVAGHLARRGDDPRKRRWN